MTECPVLLYGVNLPAPSLKSLLCPFAKKTRLSVCLLGQEDAQPETSGHPMCMPNSKHLPTCRSGTSDFQNVSAKLCLLLRLVEARNIKHNLDDLHGCMLCPCFMNTGVVPKLNSGRSAVRSLRHHCEILISNSGLGEGLSRSGSAGAN